MMSSSQVTLVGKVAPCKMVDLQEYNDLRGNLCVVETRKEIDFEIKRIFYVYEVPAETTRGDHAHRKLEQLVIAVYGCFDVTIDDGLETARFRLDTPNRGLYIGPMVWNSLINFSEGAVGLVLASNHYDEADYYREYNEFHADAGRLA